MRYLFLIPALYVWLNCPVSAQSVYTIDATKTRQTIHGFGASDAWSDELIKLMDDSSRNAAADWLFSKETNPDGSLRGAGLSIWRYNLGAGSAEQGNASGISDPYRRTERIIEPGGAISPGKQTDSQWMLHAAKSRGIENLVMFSNSPPVDLTLNGKAYSDNCGKSNLSPENNAAFADYLCKSLQYFENKGIAFDYISPVNEPEWGWCQKDGQEGNPYEVRQICDLSKKINQSLIAGKVKTKIQVPESGLLLFANPGFKFKPGRQNEIRSFFNKGKGTYLGDQERVARQICAHSYFTEWPLWLGNKIRKHLSRVAGRHDIEYWMTEYCILKTTPEITGSGRDLGMNTALYVARVMHNDLVYGNASAWCWWLGLSSADFKDGLIYVNRDGTGLVDSKLLWAMGNYSRFIIPGAVRIEMGGKQSDKFMTSAYRNPDNSLVIIVINMMDQERSLELKNVPGNITAWETSRDKNLGKAGTYKGHEAIKISPMSITTLISKN